MFGRTPTEETLDRLLSGFLKQAAKANFGAFGDCGAADMNFMLEPNGGNDIVVQTEVAALVVWLQLQPEITSVASEHK